ncbi:MAG: hypothetical protein WBB39_03790 [Candidatus Saccharimonadales bacterium]
MISRENYDKIQGVRRGVAPPVWPTGRTGQLVVRAASGSSQGNLLGRTAFDAMKFRGRGTWPRGLGESRLWRVARPETDLKLCFK